MTIDIPVWLLWTFGIGGGLVLLVLACLGVLYIRAARAFDETMRRHFGW